MGAIHQVGNIKIQYLPAADRIKIIPENGTIYWTNSFSVVRREFKKNQGKQLSMFKV